MSKIQAEATLFGLDLRQAGAYIQLALRQMAQWPFIQRWLPTTEAVWRDGLGRTHIARLSGDQCLEIVSPVPVEAVSSAMLSPGTHALCLDHDQVLERLLRMPQMPLHALESAVLLDVQTSSPFASEDTVWAFRVLLAERSGANAPCQVLVGMASRTAVQAALQRLSTAGAPEVWLQTTHGPLMLKGYAETIRIRRERAKVVSWIIGAVAVAGVLLGIMVTPVLQLRQQAHDATRKFEVMHQSTVEQQVQRQAVLLGVQDLAALLPSLKSQIDQASVLKVLTQLLPDDTSLEMVHFQGSALRLRGLSDNAAAIVQSLSSTPGFKEVRMPSAVTRMQLLAKESFLIEAKIDAEVFGVYRQVQGNAAVQAIKAQP